MDSFSFCISEKAFILTWLFKDIFPGCRILLWQFVFSFFQYLKDVAPLFCFPIRHLMSSLLLLLYMSFFSCSFEDFSVSLILLTCAYVSLVLEVCRAFWNLGFIIFIGKTLAIISSNIFFLNTHLITHILGYFKLSHSSLMLCSFLKKLFSLNSFYCHMFCNVLAVINTIRCIIHLTYCRFYL